MKGAILLTFSFVLGAFANDVLTIKEFGEKYGSGKCTEDRIKEIENEKDNCTQKVDESIKEDWHDEWCKYLENILGCLDPYDECYDIEEMKKLNATVLQFVVDLWEEKGQDFEELRECPIYKELIGDAGRIIAVISGGIIAFIFITICCGLIIKTINKNTVRRI